MYIHVAPSGDCSQFTTDHQSAFSCDSLAGLRLFSDVWKERCCTFQMTDDNSFKSINTLCTCTIMALNSLDVLFNSQENLDTDTLTC